MVGGIAITEPPLGVRLLKENEAGVSSAAGVSSLAGGDSEAESEFEELESLTVAALESDESEDFPPPQAPTSK
jgi:hypothetical protein